MFSPNLAPADTSRPRSRVRRNPPKETSQSQQSQEDLGIHGSARQSREELLPGRTRKTARKEEDVPKEKEKRDESIIWVCGAADCRSI